MEVKYQSRIYAKDTTRVGAILELDAGTNIAIVIVSNLATPFCNVVSLLQTKTKVSILRKKITTTEKDEEVLMVMGEITVNIHTQGTGTGRVNYLLQVYHIFVHFKN